MIAITLPRNLIDKIIRGEKTIELRKTYPALESLFMTVYVVEKGTKRVPIKFQVKAMVRRSPIWIWTSCRDYIGISFDEFSNYAKGSKELCAWLIDEVKELSPTFDIDCLGIKKAPQSFVYINSKSQKVL